MTSGSEDERDEDEALLSLFFPARELIGLASLAGEALVVSLAGAGAVLHGLAAGTYSVVLAASLGSVTLLSPSLVLL